MVALPSLQGPLLLAVAWGILGASAQHPFPDGVSLVATQPPLVPRPSLPLSAVGSPATCKEKSRGRGAVSEVLERTRSASLMGVRRYFTVGLICVSPTANGHLFCACVSVCVYVV